MNWRPPLRGCHAPTRPRHSGWPDASFPAWPPWTPRPGSAVTEGATADLEDNLPSRDCPGDTFAISALVRKRAELAGLVERSRAELDALTTNLGHSDATLRLFDPKIRLDAVRPKAPRPL